jgi:hypothetical protein
MQFSAAASAGRRLRQGNGEALSQGGARSSRVPQCVAVALASAAAVFLILVLLTPIPGGPSLILAGLGFLVFLIGYLRSPFFARRGTGPPCPRCGGTGYFIEMHPFVARRDMCPTCHGSGVVNSPQEEPL